MVQSLGTLSFMVHDHINVAIQRNRLPDNFFSIVDNWYRPLAEAVAGKHQALGSTFVLGVQGTQGSGKSTLADFLTVILSTDHQLNTVALSIDDFYLTLEERLTLARTVHPLLKTRGVPGTHDVQLAVNTIDQLKALSSGQSLSLPRFNKAIDDREPESAWTRVSQPVDIIIFEGWCVGMQSQLEDELTTSVNRLEADEDPDGRWRHYVNQALAKDYHDLFSRLNALAVLKAPSFACVYEWRLLQEQKLAASLANASDEMKSKILSPEQVERFISHYQRLTEHGLQTLPQQADWTLHLDQNHVITQMTQRDDYA